MMRDRFRGDYALYLVLNFINTVTYFVPEGRESDSAVLGWGTHHAEAEPL